jgi:hypothetical protein
MLSVIYADCHLCLVSFILISFMLSVTIKPIMLCVFDCIYAGVSLYIVLLD